MTLLGALPNFNPHLLAEGIAHSLCFALYLAGVANEKATQLI